MFADDIYLDFWYTHFKVSFHLNEVNTTNITNCSERHKEINIKYRYSVDTLSNFLLPNAIIVD